MNNWKEIVPWVITAVAVFTSIGFAITLATSAPDGVKTTLDFIARLFGPICAAGIAWAGVDHTVRNSRKQDQSKEWYANVRWAADLCKDKNQTSVQIGVAVLDSLDDLPFLGTEEQKLIDELLKTVVDSLAESDNMDNTITSEIADEKEAR
ncbi:hypothetical protein [Corynebacterium meitnerae]|uniref:Uncharacterized protein n=1 Tax=Corynebacterium meitnerae TaxID=2913498 RepID=A0A9X3LUC5_9CORY|nr:hypothetical protein [Corynebacterium meitnerae]MCZ9293941.1 hypothetical protein [Corynebacterium meitnerae]